MGRRGSAWRAWSRPFFRSRDSFIRGLIVALPSPTEAGKALPELVGVLDSTGTTLETAGTNLVVLPTRLPRSAGLSSHGPDSVTDPSAPCP
jgi:hypothetical protein